MLEMSLSHAVTEAELTIAIEVRNKSREVVYVPVLPIDAEFEGYPNSAYVHLTNDETAACLLLGPSLLPMESDVEMQMCAHYTTIAPGGRWQHPLRFPLPLREWYAYRLPTAAHETEPVLVYQVKVFVEAVYQSNARSVQPAPGHEKLFQLTAKKDEMLHQTITLDDRLPVLKMNDEEFPRV